MKLCHEKGNIVGINEAALILCPRRFQYQIILVGHYVEFATRNVGRLLESAGREFELNGSGAFLLWHQISLNVLGWCNGWTGQTRAKTGEQCYSGYLGSMASRALCVCLMQRPRMWTVHFVKLLFPCMLSLPQQ